MIFVQIYYVLFIVSSVLSFLYWDEINEEHKGEGPHSMTWRIIGSMIIGMMWPGIVYQYLVDKLDKPE